MDYPTIQNLNDSVSGILTSTDLDNVTDLYGAYERAARTLIQKAYIPDSVGREEVVLYDGIYDYASPITMFGTKINDLRPQGNTRSAWDFVYKKPGEQFDREKKYLRNGAEVTVENDHSNPILRAVSTGPRQKIVIDAMNSLTGWSIATLSGQTTNHATNLSLDSTVFYNNNGSLRFNISAGGTHAYISKTLTSPLNLSDYQGVGVVFVPMRLPSATSITPIGIKIGSDSSNYYAVSVTEGFIGSFRVGEWLVMAFDLSLATTTGTPVITAMDFYEVDCTYDGTAQTNVYVGGMWISLPSPHTLLFQSAAIFQATGANASSTIVNGDDSIILNDAAYNLFLHEAAIAVAFNMGGKLSGGQIASINQILHGVRARNGAVIQFGLYDLYRSDNPNEQIQQTGNYYDD